MNRQQEHATTVKALVARSVKLARKDRPEHMWVETALLWDLMIALRDALDFPGNMVMYPVTALTKVMDRLESKDQCEAHTCDYYTIYLAYGPADLTHEGFHAALVKCAEVQTRISSWIASHREGQTIPTALLQQAAEWEARIRA